jgi:hypothetical protein
VYTLHTQQFNSEYLVLVHKKPALIMDWVTDENNLTKIDRSWSERGAACFLNFAKASPIVYKKQKFLAVILKSRYADS